MLEMSAPVDVFAATYSPRRIRFLLTHWESLASIALDPRGGRGEADALDREWEVLTTDPNAYGVCVCERRGYWRPTAEEYPGGSGWQPESADNVAALLADIERATDALPIHWAATRAIFAQQDRVDTWGARLATHRHLGMQRPQDRGIEPSDSAHLVFRLLAGSLGWRDD